MHTRFDDPLLPTTTICSERQSVDLPADRGRPGWIETAAVVLSLMAFAVVLAVDVVRTAPSDAPMVQATFDVAPPVNWTSPSPRDRFTTNEAAEEIRSADARQ